jgi:hypothetical protein
MEGSQAGNPTQPLPLQTLQNGLGKKSPKPNPFNCKNQMHKQNLVRNMQNI